MQVNDFRLSGGLVRAFPGPRFGASGLREACGVEEGEPMVMTALKPMGLSVEELARQTYEFAKGRDPYNQGRPRFGEPEVGSLRATRWRRAARR